MLVGESFFLIERDENDQPIELWSVPPHWVKMTPYLGSPGYMITCPLRLARSVAIFSTTASRGLLEYISSHSAVFREGGLAQPMTGMKATSPS